MNQWTKHLAVITSLAVLCAGCASTQSGSSAEPRYRPDPATASCFYARQVHDWTVLDRRNLLVYAPRNTPYHVEIMSSAGNIRFADALAFNSRDNRICSFGGDSVIFGDGSMPNDVSITGVYRLGERGLHELLVAFGKAEPLEELTPAETEGAEIENVAGSDTSE